MTDLKSYFHDKYKGGEDFIENVILPIFGEDKYEDAYEEDVLENNPELVSMADSIGISQVLRLGTINIPMNPTDVFDITVSNHVQMERNRVAIQQLVRRIMSTYSSAFMVFHYDDDARWDWRFTFCSKQGSNKDTTDSKRYTFLFGPNQSCRTAADNFNKLADKRGNIELDDIIKAFDVEALSKEFFTKYKEQYEKFCNYVYDNKNNSSLFGEEFAIWEDKKIRDYVKKLLGRIVFLHFLQKKGWMGVPADKEWGDGDQQFMLHLFEKATSQQKSNYLDAVLEPLFSNALDTDRTNHDDLFDTGVAGFRNVKIPYLNGGLFEKDELDQPKSVFPAEYFDGLFRFFYQYNFTIDENDPNDAQVGVDPEMLGRIFENLLEDNKDKGAFYTPKEIVQYMCKESLIAYLHTGCCTDRARKAARHFVEHHDTDEIEKLYVQGEDGHDTGDSVLEFFDDMLQKVKICDPAIGSGAFPMGLLKEIFYCRMAIEKFTDAAEIKKHIIQQNIYGVDIEKGAVDIARLRFWLALIVDEQTPHALPNMDFKIMQGNSLLEQYKGVDLSDIYDPQKLQLVIAFDEETQAKTLLQEHIFKYFHTTDHSERKTLIASINTAVQSLVKAKTYGNPRISKNLSSIDFKNNTDFFLWHTWFHDVFEEGGFDIVIGNPPYIQLQANEGELAEIYDKTGYQTFAKMGDIYCLFYEQGYNLLKAKGHLCFITSDKWMRAGYGEKTRAFFASKTNPKLLVDFDGVNIFDSATVVTNILLFAKEKNIGKTMCSSTHRGDANKSITEFLSQEQTVCSFTTKDTWTILDKLQQKINKKIKKTGKLLSEWDINMYYGIKTGFNDAFIITTEKRAEILSKCKNEQEYKRTDALIRPILRGRDIHRYSYQWADLWIIAFLPAKKFNIEDYPCVKDFLLSFGLERLEQTGNTHIINGVKIKSRKKTSNKWFETQDSISYWEDFDKPKIAWGNLNAQGAYVIAEKDFYINAPSPIIVPASKYLLGALNSKVADYYIRQLGVTRNGGYFEYKPMFVEKIPIPDVSNETTKEIEALVDRILSAKKSNPQSDTSALEAKIDRLVYDLYGLTEDEIKMVEGKN